MALIVKDILVKELESVFEKLGLNKEDVTLTYSNKPELADYQCNSAFAIAKRIGKNPIEIASAIAEGLKGHDLFDASFSAPAFVNIKLTDKFLNQIANEVLKDKECLIKKPQEKLTVVMDYGGANVAKELHIGHLRSPIIGEALYRLYKLLYEFYLQELLCKGLKVIQFCLIYDDRL